jgi:hypothetical protein
MAFRRSLAVPSYHRTVVYGSCVAPLMLDTSMLISILIPQHGQIFDSQRPDPNSLNTSQTGANITSPHNPQTQRQHHPYQAYTQTSSPSPPPSNNPEHPHYPPHDHTTAPIYPKDPSPS